MSVSRLEIRKTLGWVGSPVEDPTHANCALCGCFNEVMFTPMATPICKEGGRCAERIRENLLLGRYGLVILVK